MFLAWAIITQWQKIWLSTAASVDTRTTLSYTSPVAKLVSHWKLEAGLSFLNSSLCPLHPPFHVSHYQASMKWPIRSCICQRNLRSSCGKNVFLRLAALSKGNISLYLKYQYFIMDMISHRWEGLAKILIVFFRAWRYFVLIHIAQEWDYFYYLFSSF